MRNRDLIRRLQKYDGELNVTTSDKKGIFSSINDVRLSELVGNDTSIPHTAVTLVLGENLGKLDDTLPVGGANSVSTEGQVVTTTTTTTGEVYTWSGENSIKNDIVNCPPISGVEWKDLDDDEFIDKVNSALKPEEQINKEEALKAKKVFDQEQVQQSDNSFKLYNESFFGKFEKFEKDFNEFLAHLKNNAQEEETRGTET